MSIDPRAGMRNQRREVGVAKPSRSCAPRRADFSAGAARTGFQTHGSHSAISETPGFSAHPRNPTVQGLIVASQCDFRSLSSVQLKSKSRWQAAELKNKIIPCCIGKSPPRNYCEGG